MHIADADVEAVMDNNLQTTILICQVSLHDSTFSRTVWWLYGGAKGLVMTHDILPAGGARHDPPAELAPGEYVTKCRFQSKRAFRYIRLPLFPRTFR